MNPDASPLERELFNLAAENRVSVWFDKQAKKQGYPFIVLKKYDLCLAVFSRLHDAVYWFPRRTRK